MTGVDFAAAKTLRLSAVIGQSIQLKRQGHEWAGLCPFHGEHTPSFTVNDAKGFAHCFGCGWHGDAADFVSAVGGVGLREAVARLGSGDASPPLQPLSAARREETDTIDAARKIWTSAGPITGTVGAAYLFNRGITMKLPDSLRFARLKHPAGGIHPAVVALVVTPDRRIAGVQRIFVAEDGAGKAKVPTTKLSLGRIAGNAIRLGPPAKEVIITEGLEDALSVQQALGKVTWAAAGASMMSRMVFPLSVERVVIGRDNDPAGEREAAKAALLFNERGLAVRIMAPAGDAKDFNQALIASEEARGITA